MYKGNQTLYYYDGIRVILEKTKASGSGTWSTSQVYTLHGGAIGFIVSSRDTATGDDTWYHYDRLGTVMNLTDYTGAVTATYSQDAFGNVLSGSSDGFHLTTKRHYSAIGLYYFYIRWYDPVLGRFSTKSPMPSYFEHPYIYGNNNPLFFIDPYGLMVCLPGSAGEMVCFPPSGIVPPSIPRERWDKDGDTLPDWADPHPSDRRYPAGYKFPGSVPDWINPNSPDPGPDPPFGNGVFPNPNAGPWTPPPWDDVAISTIIVVSPAIGIPVSVGILLTPLPFFFDTANSWCL